MRTREYVAAMGARSFITPLALALLAAPLAYAQSTEPGIAGSELIAAANADGVFELLPSEQLVVVRHTGSGMICTFDPSYGSRLFVAAEGQRGDSVSCDTEDSAGHFTLSATRLTEARPIDESMSEAMDGIGGWARELRPLSSEANAAPGTLPENRSTSFVFAGPEGDTYGRAGVAITEGWLISLFYSAPAATAEDQVIASQRSHMLWTSALAQLEVMRD